MKMSISTGGLLVLRIILPNEKYMKNPNTKYQILNTNKVKDFVNNFCFPDPKWDNLPFGFPDVPVKGLTRQEEHLLSGIKLAWMATQSKGKKHLYVNTIKAGIISSVILAMITLAGDFVKSPEWQYTKEVSAATASATLKEVGGRADEMIQSTMSAILRK